VSPPAHVPGDLQRVHVDMRTLVNDEVARENVPATGAASTSCHPHIFVAAVARLVLQMQSVRVRPIGGVDMYLVRSIVGFDTSPRGRRLPIRLETPLMAAGGSSGYTSLASIRAGTCGSRHNYPLMPHWSQSVGWDTCRVKSSPAVPEAQTAGISAATSARMVGVADAPVVGPARIVSRGIASE